MILLRFLPFSDFFHNVLFVFVVVGIFSFFFSTSPIWKNSGYPEIWTIAGSFFIMIGSVHFVFDGDWDMCVEICQVTPFRCQSNHCTCSSACKNKRHRLISRLVVVQLFSATFRTIFNKNIWACRVFHEEAGILKNKAKIWSVFVWSAPVANSSYCGSWVNKQRKYP